MADPVELMLSDLNRRYSQMSVSDDYMRLYTDDARFGRVFGSFHERLNQHFDAINDRAWSSRHYWAENSREMLALVDELGEVLRTLKSAGVEVVFAEEYSAGLERCKPWLSSNHGSAVPEDFDPVQLIRYQPVFVSFLRVGEESCAGITVHDGLDSVSAVILVHVASGDLESVDVHKPRGEPRNSITRLRGLV